MPHPISIPTPTTPSSVSEESNPPTTPISPSMQPQMPEAVNSASPNAAIASAAGKRKPSRRANTAERRATHNAVERQRRETLNGRFLDLAALLPNLSQIRRPSKSAIVNSSIAHVHASRRHRLLAARELRLLKLEADAIRRELNEWRDRAGLPRVEEPVRSDAFSVVLSAELEISPAIPEDDEDGYEDGDDDYGAAAAAAAASAYPADDLESPQVNMMLKNSYAPRGGHYPVRPGPTPMIASAQPSVSFENPAMNSLYEPHYSGHILQQEVDKVGSWAVNNAMYSNHQIMQQQQQQQRAMYTPPSSSHGMPMSNGGVPPQGFNDPAFFASLQRQQMGAMMQSGNMYAGVDNDDSSSVGSGHSGRGRSSSVSTGSGYGGSPQHPGHVSAEYAQLLNRPIDSRGIVEGWRDQEMKQNVGGGGGGYAMMMM